MSGRQVVAWALLGSLIGVLMIQLEPLTGLEERLGLAWLFNVRGPVEAPADVVIVALDEQSERDASRPHSWPRKDHARLVRYLAKEGASVITFDLTFSAGSTDPGDDDEAFARAIGAAANVVLTESIALATPGVVIESPPIGILADAALGYAPFLLPKDAQVSKYWKFFELEGRGGTPTLPVLAFEASQARSAAAAERRGRVQSLMRRRAASELSHLNFYGPPRTIETIPYARVMAWAEAGEPGRMTAAAPMSFRDKAVFIGYSAATPAGQDRLRDNYRTVYSRADGLDLSGVEIAATAFANLRDERPLRAPAGLGIGICAVWGFVSVLACRRLRPLQAFVVVAVVVAAYLGVAYERFVSAAWWLPTIVPAGVQAPLALFAGVWLGYRKSTREREVIKRAFGYFLPSAVVDQLARNVGPVTRGNEVVFGACLATDLENYTALAEQMEPARLGELMNAYYAELFVPVEESRGVVVDVVGDAMVAVWAKASSGIELRRRACRAALDIIARLDRFNGAVPDRPGLATRFGLHAGDMLVGSIGGSGHFEYRAVGDIVNTASRIQALNKVMGTRLLASDVTVAGLHEFATRPLGSFLMAGKANRVEVVEVLGLRQGLGETQAALCASFAAALDRYRADDCAEAARHFAAILATAPHDGPSRFYLEHCEQVIAQPPNAVWTASIRIDTK